MTLISDREKFKTPKIVEGAEDSEGAEDYREDYGRRGGVSRGCVGG